MKHTRKIALCLCRLLLITGFVWMAAFPSVRAADSIVLENGTELQYTVSTRMQTRADRWFQKCPHICGPIKV